MTKTPPKSKRRLIGALPVLVGVVVLAWWGGGGGRRDVELVYDLGEAQAAATGLEVVIRQDEVVQRRAQWRWRPGKAPQRVSHRPSLPEEALEVELRLERGGELTRWSQPLDLQGPGDRVVLHLAPE